MLPGRPSGRTRTRLRRLLGVATVLAAVLASSAWIPSASMGASGPTPPPTPMTTQAWHSAMVRVATPAKGCFAATYPTLAWHSAACAKAPDRPYPPRPGGGGTSSGSAHGPAGSAYAPAGSPYAPTGSGSGLGPAVVGNGIDFSAGVTGVMTGATGSFPTVSGVTSVTSASVPNAYSLQLNTKPFVTTVCGAQPLCKGWEQFIYSNQGFAFIQFWLLQYNMACPGGWNTYIVGADTYCYKNGSAVAITPQPITNLGNLSLTGTVTGGGSGLDTVSMSTGGPSISASTTDSTLNLSVDWAAVEFMIGGDGGGSQAVFNAGSTIVVQTVTHNGTTLAPTCLSEGYTGETNNLTLVGTPTLAIGASPAIRSTQSNVPGAAASCASASGIGDTHLHTFDGLYYDFQARGDFLLAQTPTLTVQNRQISGAPLWSNAAVNSGVATQMGHDRVALCLPNRLVVNGATTALASGGAISLPSGNKIRRTGNAYVTTDPHGDSVSATMNGIHIDVKVGLGAYPAPVSGLLANAPGNVYQMVTRTGQLLATPIDFQTMYKTYGESWRVTPSASLLSDCGSVSDTGTPTAPFWAGDLQKTVHDQAQAVCHTRGVQDATLLDACTLDVAVLGQEAAAVYVGEAAPVAVGFR